ncbi:unnamed protein product [Cladocopium goreaui]|uniref:AMP-dependent synthetase/ligase domain-containing protein n=1 Tax=Cladocopium goreaui TaxID=2562237 RepID=A0A9P1DRN3_9DINO|nr:unnamed protein product [Cladocopium goreaui]
MEKWRNQLRNGLSWTMKDCNVVAATDVVARLDATVLQHIQEKALSAASQPALLWLVKCEDGWQKESWTYKEVWQAAISCAEKLKALPETSQGCHVAICIDEGPALPLVELGVLLAAMCIVPLDACEPTGRFVSVVADSEPAVIVAKDSSNRSSIQQHLASDLLPGRRQTAVLLAAELLEVCELCAEDRLLLLSRVLSQLPKAKVVLSSTWRRDEALFLEATQQLEAHQVRISGTTPISGYETRVDEICAWLEASMARGLETTSFVVLDDQAMDEGRVVYTDPSVGLEEAVATRVLERFQSVPPSETLEATLKRWRSKTTARSRPKNSAWLFACHTALAMFCGAEKNSRAQKVVAVTGSGSSGSFNF